MVRWEAETGKSLKGGRQVRQLVYAATMTPVSKKDSEDKYPKPSSDFHLDIYTAHTKTETSTLRAPH